jgi:hypothetical protein
MLKDSDTVESKVGDALLDLNKKAGAIRNKELQAIAFKVCDTANGESKHLVAYKAALISKYALINEMLLSILRSGGHTKEFYSLVVANKDNVASLNSTLDDFNKGMSDYESDLEVQVARFKGLAQIN